MNIEYSLKDVELKLHDARRQLEGLLELEKMGIKLPNDAIKKFQDYIIEINRLTINFYIAHQKGDIQKAEEITLETPSNVLDFPKKPK